MNSSSLDLLTYEANQHLLTAIGILVNTFLSLPLNIYKMFLILSRASLAQDVFCLNLAVSESLYCLLSLTFFGILAPSCPWLFYEIYMFSAGLAFTTRPLLQCCICIEFYLGVVHPVFFLRCRPPRYRAACCGAIWLITLVACLSTENILSVPLYSYIFFGQNVLLVSVMVFCCVSVLRALKQPGPGEGGPERRGGDAMKRRAFNIIFLFMVHTFVNMLLYVIVIPLQCCLSQQGLGIAWKICNSLVMFTGFTQPLLYLYRAAKLDCCRGT